MIYNILTASREYKYEGRLIGLFKSLDIVICNLRYKEYNEKGMNIIWTVRTIDEGIMLFKLKAWCELSIDIL